jgi:hypothetical protein
MTNPELIVVSIDMAKKLKEAGWDQNECLWRWVEFHGGVAKGHSDYESNTRWELREKGSDYNFDPRYAAPTAEEILRRLPESLMLQTRGDRIGGNDSETAFDLEMGKNKYGYFVRYEKEAAEEFYADTLANAAAQMWIYLKEHSLLCV